MKILQASAIESGLVVDRSARKLTLWVTTAVGACARIDPRNGSTSVTAVTRTVRLRRTEERRLVFVLERTDRVKLSAAMTMEKTTGPTA